MKFRCTLTIDLDMPKDRNEEGASAVFAGYIAGALMFLIPKEHIKDYHLIDCKAQKITRKNLHV